MCFAPIRAVVMMPFENRGQCNCIGSYWRPTNILDRLPFHNFTLININATNSDIQAYEYALPLQTSYQFLKRWVTLLINAIQYN